MSIKIKKFNVRYISDVSSPFFKKGEIYEAYLPLDEQSGKLLALTEPDGEDYAYAASLFERVED